MLINAINTALTQQKKEENGKKFGIKLQIYGATGSGKTYLSKKAVLSFCKKPLIYRMTDDWDQVNEAFIFKPRNYKEDLEPFIVRAVASAKKGLIDSLVFDEADLLFPSSMREPPQIIKDLFDLHRHYRISLIFISRRPQNITTFISEECHFTAVLSVEGSNVKKRFNAIYEGWGDQVSELVFKSHKYSFKAMGQPPQICDPI